MTPHVSEDKTDDFGAAVAQFRLALRQHVDAHLSAHPHAGVPRAARAAAPRFSTRSWALGAAVVLLIVATASAVLWPRGPQRYTTGEAGTQFTLPDGSGVEMRGGTELTVDRAADGLRIRLTNGGIIVNAAKQRAGHLYVETKDMTVAVVGTVFVVNAAEDGSRVAVIEGEVRVREGRTETRLRPGEQVSTNPTLQVRPVADEIAWSRRAPAHLALFQQAVPQRLPQRGDASAAAAEAQSAAPRPQFEEASIRPCDPENLPPTPSGRGGPVGNTFQATPGRARALCVTLATLVRTAYGSRPSDPDFLGGRGMSLNVVYGLGVEDGIRVRGGPDWVRSERYTVDAIAGSAADVETMRGPMLLALLEQRFRLKAHIEAEQIPAFELTVAKGGLKLRPAGIGACAPLSEIGEWRPRGFADVRRGEKPTCGLFGFHNGPNTVTVGGEITLDALVRQLSTPPGGTFDAPLSGIRVIDKTGITDTFNFVLEYVRDGNNLAGVPPQSVEPSGVPRGPSIFTALEDQLGLKLEPVRAPREFIVIDQVERPGTN